MPETNNHRGEKYLRYALAIFGILLVVLLVFLAQQYRALRHQEFMSNYELRWSELLERHGPLPVTSASVIRSWMTFDYVNKLFALPPDYLKTQLDITSANYPRTTISSYGKSQGLNEATFVSQVESAVGAYAAPPASSTSTTSKST